MWHHYYNIHDLVSIEVIGNRRFGRSNNLRYSFFETERVASPDIVLHIGRFNPSNQGCHIISHKYHVKENYFYCRDSEKRARWEIEIFGFEEGKTKVNFSVGGTHLRNLLLPNYWAQDIVKPLIEFKLLQKSYFSTHGGAVGKDAKAYVFSGRGGAFKTTLIMDLVRRANFDFLGDERVIIGKGEVLPFPLSPFLFDYALKHSATEDLGFLSKLRLLGQILFEGKRYEAPVIKVSKPVALFFIEKKERRGVTCTELGSRMATTKLIANNKLELTIPSPVLVSSHFLHYMMAYSFVFPNSQIARYWDELRNGLEEAFKDVPIYLLEIPADYSAKTFEEVYKHIAKRSAL